MKRNIVIFVSLLLAAVIPLNLAGCASVTAADLMEDVVARNVEAKNADDTFIASQMEFAVKLFKESVAHDNGENDNILISPLSVQLALAMTANGADGNTRSEMENLLGSGITVEELNGYLKTYVDSLPSSEKYKLQIANSIWFRDDDSRIAVEKNFLQLNADYYGADAYKSPFDRQTVKDINSWVSRNTDGMIDNVLDSIDQDAVMFLINALAFDAEWAEMYEKDQVREGKFTTVTGEKQTVEMMHSGEGLYIDTGKSTGFIKNYKDAKYSFVALLPNEGTDIYDYISEIDASVLHDSIKNAQSESVIATMPKFSYEYELSMNDTLKALGMPTAFDSYEADFSKLGRSSYGNICIGDVLHKTFISVGERGTRAGAVTTVQINETSAPNVIMQRYVTLDRPFVYMIVDNSTDLPLFIGAVTEIAN